MNQRVARFVSILAVASLAWLFPLHGSPGHSEQALATVRLDGRSLFQVGPKGTTPASDRARRIERRLQSLVGNAIANSYPSVDASNDNRSISVAGLHVVEITPEDAQNNVTTADDLAARWSTDIEIALKRARKRRLSLSGRFIAETQGSVETAFARLLDSTVYVVPRALAAITVMALFWGVAGAIRLGLRLLFQRFTSDETTASLVKQAIYYGIIAVGLVVAVDALGFEPQTVVTGLGLTGLALGFALKDIVSNFVSGLLILSLRPFDLGDQIIVGTTEGAVERIELRATLIRTYDGRVALVPNADVFTSRIVNNTAHPIRRGSVTSYLSYDEDLPRAVRTLLAAVPSAEGVSPGQPGTVRVRELGAAEIVLDSTFWTDSRRSDFSDTASNVRMTIVAAFKREGIGLPNPDRRVIIKSPAETE